MAFALDDLRIGLRFLGGLPRFLRTPIDLRTAAARVERRLEGRGAALAARVAEVAAQPGSPYARLLAHAGWPAPEVAASIGREGVEATLARLFRAGVYLTVEEWKGRRPVRRGSLEFAFEPRALRNPRAAVHGLATTSGSRGAPTQVPLDFAFIADHAVNTALSLAAQGDAGWRHAYYGVPGGTSVTHPLEMAKAGRPLDRRFTSVDFAAPGLDARYRLGERALRRGSALCGVRMPRPIRASLDDPAPIARWMADELVRGRTPHLWSYASSAVLVCQAARRAGLDLAGARFTMGGEPTTAARRGVVEETGAVALPRMGATETDILSAACVRPEASDDMHFFHDRHALVAAGADGAAAGLPARALLLTSLLPTAPVVLLNVCLGDQAEVGTRACGCPLERHGWTLHLRHVRSFEKLTVGGTTLLDAEVVRVLEEDLPARFGGAPTDYQLLERLDAADGRTELQLLVHPGVGPLDARLVAETFLAALDRGAGGEHLTALQWRDAGVLTVAREAPHRTASGKIVHLHLARASPAA